MCPSLSAAADRYNQGAWLEAAMDREDVTCAISIIHRRGAVCFKSQEAACGNRLQEGRKIVRNLKMFMHCGNHELFEVRGSNDFVCHSGVSKNTIYEKDPVVRFAGKEAYVMMFRLCEGCAS